MPKHLLPAFVEIVEQAPDAIVLVDPEGRVAYANPRVQALFGLMEGLDEARRAAERIARVKGEFLAMAAHNLSQPEQTLDLVVGAIEKSDRRRGVRKYCLFPLGGDRGCSYNQKENI